MGFQGSQRFFLGVRNAKNGIPGLSEVFLQCQESKTETRQTLDHPRPIPPKARANCQARKQVARTAGDECFVLMLMFGFPCMCVTCR